MRVCVCTAGHHPDDARILHRQIRALLDAGHQVTYLAPFRACNATPWPGLTPVDVPRLSDRFRALRHIRRALNEHAPHTDLVLLHDPELSVVAPRRVPVLIDGPVTRRSSARLDSPTLTPVPPVPLRPPDDRRVVHLGRLSRDSGVVELIELARLLHAEGVATELIGAPDEDARPLLRAAQRDGVLRWYGYVPNDRALRIISGASAGLSFPRRPRSEAPTPVLEYMAHGVPVISFPEPSTSFLLDEIGSGLTVRDVPHAHKTIHHLLSSAPTRADLAKRGHEAAALRFDWAHEAPHFLATLEAAVTRAA
ncbi:glycosyltransferase family protein [Actinocorallia lasiicapitis]